MQNYKDNRNNETSENIKFGETGGKMTSKMAKFVSCKIIDFYANQDIF